MIIHSPSTRIISQKTGLAGSKTVFRQSMVFERCSGVAARTGISPPPGVWIFLCRRELRYVCQISFLPPNAHRRPAPFIFALSCVTLRAWLQKLRLRFYRKKKLPNGLLKSGSSVRWKNKMYVRTAHCHIQSKSGQLTRDTEQ